MKTLLYSTVLCLLLAACNGGTSEGESENGDETGAASKKNISKRDYSINASNSYSDLFFDSTALESFLAGQKIPDSLGNRVRSFYNARNFQYAWFTSEGFTQQALAFWNLFDHYTTYSNDTTLANRPLEKQMNRLLGTDNFTVKAGEKNFLQTEIRLTTSLIQYAGRNFEKGYVKRKELERFVPFKKQDPFELADSLLNKKHKDNKYFEDINQPYKALKQQLATYLTIHQKGGLPVIPELKKTVKKGYTGPEIPVIKKYLAITGDMPNGDTSQTFNDTLEQGVNSFQQRLGYSPTGSISKELLKDMNVSLRRRVEQLIINLERMRWMPSQPNGTLILVNIPAFQLQVLENGQKAFDMNVVVGKEGNNTMQFTGTLNQVVFSPYWNIPPNIVTKEILPAIAKNPNYLEENQMEDQGDKDGDGIPEIRQKPGDKNSLGQVKFLFPNRFDIYLHDTPAKSLFSKDKRAFSHGCIRISEPQKLAEYLLRGDANWDPAKIGEAMNKGEEKFVKLKDKAEVFITYYTAWVDESGKLNFRDDVYAHDDHMIARLFK